MWEDIGYLFEAVASLFLAFLSGLLCVVLFITAPAWIIPYLIYESRKEKIARDKWDNYVHKWE